MPIIPYYDKTALTYERAAEWSQALTRWAKVIAQNPGNAEWINARIDYCIRRMSRSSTQSYSYENYSY